MAVCIYRLALLPVDAIRLTIDFVRLTKWHVARFMAAVVGVVGPSSGPFCSRRKRSIDSAGAACLVCMHAQSYANPVLSMVLCRWVSMELVAGAERACVCRRRRSYRAPVLRYASTGAAIGLFWTSVWFSIVYWLAER